MAVPTFLQSKTYSTNTAGTSHALTLDSSVRSAGGSISPSALVMMLSYDGATGNQCSGITDTSGNTWARATSASDGVVTNGEMWYAFNVAGGSSPTITVSMSSSVKMTMACVEVDQIRPVSPLDKTSARIFAPVSNSRTSDLFATRTAGMVEVLIGGMAWTHATKTVTAGVGYTGLVTLKDATSNIGVALERRSTEQKNISRGLGIARFTFSGVADATPASIMCVSFFRDGVVTSTSEDGHIDDVEGVSVVETDVSAWGGRWLYTSSTSAPYGGTGASERSTVYSFFPDYSSYLLPGVTIGNTIPLYYIVNTSGNDDLTGFMAAYMYVFKDGTFGSTLDASDESFSGGTVHIEGTNPCYIGEHQVNLNKATEYNTSGYTTYAMQMQGDTGGTVSSTYAFVGDESTSIPDYLWLSLTYPSGGLPLKTLMGVGL